MKKVLFLSLLLSKIALSQTTSTSTAFGDAKRLIKWFKMADTAQVKKTEAKEMLTLLLYYAGNKSLKLRDAENNIFLHKLYDKVNNIYSFDVRKSLSKGTVVSRIIDSSNVPREFLSYKNDIINLYAALKRVKSQEKAIGNVRLQNISQEDVDTAKNIIRYAQPFIALTGVVVADSLPASVENAYKNQGDSLLLKLRVLLAVMDTSLQAQITKKETELFDSVMRVSPSALLDLFPRFRLSGVTIEEARRIQKNSIPEQEKTEENAVTIMIKNDETVTPPAPNLVDLNFPTQSDIIDAIAIYLVKRTKQEATLFFLETLASDLRTNQLAQDLFPSTWKVMQTMEAYSTPRFGAQWRNAIANDFIELPQSIKSSKYIEDRFPNKILYNHFSDAVTFASYIGKKYSFLDVVRTLYSDHSLLKGRWTNIAVDALYIINNELRNIDSTGFMWIKPESFLKLDSLEAYCFFDLLRLRYQDEVSDPMKDELKRIKMVKNQLPEYLRFFTEVLTTLKQFNQIQEDAAKKGKDGTIIAPDGFWDTQRNLLDFFLTQKIIKLSAKERQALNLCKSSFFIYDHLSNKNYIGAAEHVINIVSELSNNNAAELIHLKAKAVNSLRNRNNSLYSSITNLNQAFMDLGTLQKLQRYIRRSGFPGMPKQNLLDSFEFKTASFNARLIQNEHFDSSQLQMIINEVKILLSANYGLLKRQLNPDERTQVDFLFRKADTLNEKILENAFIVLSKENNRFFKRLADFAGLLTEISITKKSDELARVIESYALPPGSYRMKRNADFSIDLNAFTGFYVGAEYVKTLDKTGLVYGFTAPIGVAFSWGSTDSKVLEADRETDLTVTRKGLLRRRTQNSFTLDFTLVDLGAVVSYRFSGGAEGLPSKPKWDQVISLGANVRWGIKKTPFCIGLGMLQTPKLRTIDKDQERAFRGQLSFTFDLPLVNIYRRN